MDRIWLTLVTLAVAVGGALLMLRGWRARQRRQADVAVPPTSTGDAAVVVDWAPGLFVGTTRADDWLDRIAVHQLSDRATGEIALLSDGLHVLRDDLPELFIPLEALRGITVEQSLAGKVVSSGMLVIAWQLGDLAVCSAFRTDDPTAQRRLVDAVAPLVPAPLTPWEAA